MSSSTVRTAIFNFLSSNAGSENVIDMTGQYKELRELFSDESITTDALLVDFSADEEIPIALVANNSQGLYRETGVVSLHICEEARMGVGDLIVQRAETLKNLFRGQRIGDSITIEALSPLYTGPGATLEFEGGFVSGTVLVYYQYDNNLGG